MTYMSSVAIGGQIMDKDALYRLQDRVIADLQRLPADSFAHAKLCGGTALSRCWLDHRISYDLDFFFPEGFRAQSLAMALKKAGVRYVVHDMVDDPHKANQLHGQVVSARERLKVSFVEDAYFSVFPPITKPWGALAVQTESVEGLYHRKLRTVAGSGQEGEGVLGGRQTARDVFDLYVLSQTVMPLRPFMDTLPYAFPITAFEEGLAAMRWFDLVPELQEILCAPRWNAAKNAGVLQEALFAQLDITAGFDDPQDDGGQDPSASSRGRP